MLSALSNKAKDKTVKKNEKLLKQKFLSKKEILINLRFNSGNKQAEKAIDIMIKNNFKFGSKFLRSSNIPIK